MDEVRNIDKLGQLIEFLEDGRESGTFKEGIFIGVGDNDQRYIACTSGVPDQQLVYTLELVKIMVLNSTP